MTLEQAVPAGTPGPGTAPWMPQLAQPHSPAQGCASSAHRIPHEFITENEHEKDIDCVS